MLPKCYFLFVFVVFFSNPFLAYEFNLLNIFNPGFIDVNLMDIVFNKNSKSLRYNISDIARSDVDDKYLNTTELLRKYNRTVQEYQVTTEDGYILTLIRIPASGPAVFLMHGLPFSSDDFVTAGPYKALAYLLANATYDVWLGNARGNKYSKSNVRFPTNSREFWNFTWNEIGYYDLPAMIDTVLEQSGQPDLNYIGHAQGTTVFFVLCSLRPEYNTKIRLYISLATITYVWHVKSPVARALIPLRQQEYDISQALGLYEFFPNSPAVVFLFSEVCSSSRLALDSCMTVLFTVLGFDYGQLDYDNLPTELSHFPADSSFKQLVHYLQLAASRRFAQFDFGKERNMAQYNRSTPPSYPVEKVTVPVVIFYADNDFLSVFQDVELLIKRLPNVVNVIRVPNPQFNHIDYLWGKDAPQLIYRPILDILDESYESCSCSGSDVACKGVAC